MLDIDNPIVIITLIIIALFCRAYISYAENNANEKKKQPKKDSGAMEVKSDSAAASFDKGNAKKN